MLTPPDCFTKTPLGSLLVSSLFLMADYTKTRLAAALLKIIEDANPENGGFW
jgi:hypothetical protein